MHVVGLGLSVLKGAAQQHPDRLALDLQGAVGDRRFALVDPATGRVLRTVENPRAMSLQAWTRPPVDGSAEVLVVDVPDQGRHEVSVAPSGTLVADYWGRRVQLEVLGGAAADALGSALGVHLGREVVLTRARRRDVVFGEGVTLLTTSSLLEVDRRRAAQGGARARALPELLADAERWRAALVVDTGDAPAFVEDRWHGCRLVVGHGGGGTAVRLRVTAGVARCAVVRSRPRDGAREGWDPLGLLSQDRLVDSPTGREVSFAVGAEVMEPGEVRLGDSVAVEP